MKAIIEIQGKKYESEGETVRDALAGLQYKGFAGFKSLLTIQNGEKEKVLVLPPIQTKKLFSANPMMREVTIKHIAMRFE